MAKKPTTVAGVVFPSRSSAAKSLGSPYRKVLKAAKTGSEKSIFDPKKSKPKKVR
jgi:hypothetical protein